MPLRAMTDLEAVKLAARALCQSQGCRCHTDIAFCSAWPIYADMAVAVLQAMERAGFILEPIFPPSHISS